MVKDGQVVIVDEFTGRLMPGSPLERRPAPGGRGEGKGQDRAREPDAGDGDLPELLPKVRQAVGHDRHGGHRSAGVRQDLQTRRRSVIPTNRPLWCDIEEPDTIYRTEQREVRRHRRRHHRDNRRPDGPCWSAPSPSRSRSACPPCSNGAASSTSSSTPSTTPRRRRSSPRPAAGARSPSRRTWRAGAPTSSWAATPIHMSRQQASPRMSRNGCPRTSSELRRRRRVRVLLSPGRFLSRRRADWERHAFEDQFKQQTARRARRGRRRPAACTYHRHRAPRGAAHRQPAPGPGRPAGRPRLVPVLPFSRRRPDAHLRVRPHLRV